MTEHIDRDALRKLADAATPGPWETYMDPGGPREAPFVAVEVGNTEVRIARFEGGHFDGAFIAAARTAVPALLDALDQAEARINAVRDVLDQNAPVPTIATRVRSDTIRRALDGES